MVSLQMTAGLNTAFSLLINDVLLPAASPTTGQIPVEVYTTDNLGNILEAIVF